MSSMVTAAEEVMQARNLVFVSRPPSAIAECLLYIHDVAFVHYGEYWHQEPHVAYLLSARRIGSFWHVLEQEAAAAVDLREHLTKCRY
jgi:hypothetical protein